VGEKIIENKIIDNCNSGDVLSCDICGSRQAHHVFTRQDGLGVFECSSCELAYVNSRPAKEEILRTYRDTYTDFRQLKEWFYEDRRIGNSSGILRRISRFKSLSGSRILDIGCGPGFLLYEARRLGMDTVGLEISKIYASFGREELNLDIRQTILEEADLPSAGFDVVVCNNLIEHLANPHDFFLELARILAPAGILHILTPNYDGAKEYGNEWPGFHKDFEHIFYFNAASLTYALESCGLKPMKLFYLPQRTGLTGRKNLNHQTSRAKAKIRGVLLFLPLVNRQVWRVLSLARALSNRKSLKKGTAFEMGAIFKKPQIKSKYKFAILTSHPIQYQAPLFRKIAAHPEIDLTVYFCWDFGVEKETYDSGFGIKYKWDIPLLEGYRYKFLSNIPFLPQNSFFRQINPSVVKEFFLNHYDAMLIRGYTTISNWLAFIGAWLSKTPIFLHGDSHLLRKRPFLVRLLKRLLLPLFFKKISAFLSIGTLNTEYYSYYGVAGKKIFFTPYSVDNEFFQSHSQKYKEKKAEIRRRFNLPPDVPLILYVGKLYKGKRPLDLLRAFEKLSGIEETGLIFIGEGRQKPFLQDYIKRANIKNVFFLGFKNQSQLPAFYAVSDIFVFPSGIDKWGLAINEAMASGLPVIATSSIGASYDLIKSGQNGFVYNAGDIETLRRQLEILIKDSNLRNAMGQYSRKIITDWNYDSCIEGILKALRYVRCKS